MLSTEVVVDNDFATTMIGVWSWSIKNLIKKNMEKNFDVPLERVKDFKKVMQVTLSEREVVILAFIREQEGQSTLPSVIHDCIKNYYKLQYFNKRYMEKKGKKSRGDDEFQPKVDLTPEQECERVGGKVVEINGTMSCRIPTVGESAMIMPLSAWKQFENYRKP